MDLEPGGKHGRVARRVTEFDEVMGVIRGGRFRAWLAVNVAMIETYEEIGALLSRKVRSRTRAGTLLKWTACPSGLPPTRQEASASGLGT